jgi:chromatin remodeling complex protein RSC6
MVRSSKPTASATPAVSNVVVEAPVAAAAPKKSASKKAKAVEAAPAPVVAAPVAPAPVEVAPVADVVVESTSSSAKLSEIEAKIQQLGSVLSTLKSDVKVLAKTIAREQKIASKSSKGNRKVSASRKPSGFIKPTLISDELAKFLGKNAGTEMARTDVSKEINMYIRTNNLQDKENGRKIHPDAKLSCLLNIKPGDEPLTYFNLQRFMKHHFVKTEVAATA